MAFGFGVPGLGLASAGPADDPTLSPEMLAFLRARRLGAEDALVPQEGASADGSATPGQGGAAASRPFGLASPLAGGSTDDVPAATPPGLTGFSPSPTPTGPATPVLDPSAPGLGSVARGVLSGASRSGQEMVDAARDAGSLTRGFLDGSLDTRTPGVVERGLGAAGLAMTGSMPFGAPTGALRTFGGRAAAIADHAALDQAAGMQAAGASPDAIWKETGWGLGRDGAARFEIPDDAARLLPQGKAPATTLGNVLDHPALFEAYPGMRDVNVFHRPELGADAAANPARNWIALNLDDPQALQGLLHEGQHIVQRTEGFAPGASPIDPAMAAHPQVAEAAALRQRLAGLDAPAAAALADRTDQAARMNAYRTAAGEVEARNVEARQAMTPAERAATPPWATQDVPSDRQWLPRPIGDAVTGDAAQLRMGAAPALAASQRSVAGPALAGGAAAAAGGAALAAPDDAQAASGSYADRVGHAESAGKATAKNPRSSATGYGQFIDSTWLEMMGKYRPDLASSLPKAQLLALRNDPQLSKEMIQHYGDENGAKLRAAGLPDTDGTRYLSHFAGSKGARAILKADPSVPAAQVLDPGQVAANPFVRKMTAGQLADWAAQKVGGSAATMTTPGDSSRPARFGLSGPTQAPAPSGAAAATAPAPVQPSALDKEIEMLTARLANSKGKGGGAALGFASGSSQPEVSSGSILTQRAPQRHPFSFMAFNNLLASKPASRRPTR